MNGKQRYFYKQGIYFYIKNRRCPFCKYRVRCWGGDFMDMVYGDMGCFRPMVKVRKCILRRWGK